MATVTTNGEGSKRSDASAHEEPSHSHEEPEPVEPDETASPGPAAGAAAHACNVAFCPIGLAISAVQPLRPDAVEHLLVAGRELFLAMRTIVDARADQFGGPDEAASTFEKIDIG